MDKLREEVNRLFLEAGEKGWDMTRTKLILIELLERGYNIEDDLARVWSVDMQDIDTKLNWDEGEE